MRGAESGFLQYDEAHNRSPGESQHSGTTTVDIGQPAYKSQPITQLIRPNGPTNFFLKCALFPCPLIIGKMTAKDMF